MSAYGGKTRCCLHMLNSASQRLWSVQGICLTLGEVYEWLAIAVRSLETLGFRSPYWVPRHGIPEPHRLHCVNRIRKRGGSRSTNKACSLL